MQIQPSLRKTKNVFYIFVDKQYLIEKRSPYVPRAILHLRNPVLHYVLALYCHLALLSGNNSSTK